MNTLDYTLERPGQTGYKIHELTITYYITPYIPMTRYQKNGDPGRPEEVGNI